MSLSLTTTLQNSPSEKIDRLDPKEEIKQIIHLLMNNKALSIRRKIEANSQSIN